MLSQSQLVESLALNDDVLFLSEVFHRPEFYLDVALVVLLGVFIKEESQLVDQS